MKYFLFSFLCISLSTHSQNFEAVKEQLKVKYEYVSGLTNGIATFSEHNGKTGIIDSLGTVLTPAKFNYIDISRDGYIEAGIEVKGKMKRGYINKDGSEQIPIAYDYIFRSVDSELIIVELNGKTGAIDTLNNIIIPIEYDFITYANEKRYIVKKGKLYAIYSHTGKAITNFDYKDLERYYDNNAVALLPDNTTTLLSTEGKQLFTPLKGYSLTWSKDSLVKARNTATGKYGFITIDGTFAIPCEYEDADYANGLLKLQKNKKWALYNRNNIAVTPFKYEIIIPLSIDLFEVKEKNYGIIDPSGTEVLPSVYSYIDFHQKKYFIAEDAISNYGVYNIKGQNTIPHDYKFYRIWKEKVFASKNNTPLILNLATGENIPVNAADSFKPAQLLSFEDWNKHIFIKDGKYGVISIDNKILIPAEYDDLESIYISGEFIAKKNGKFGIIDSGNTIKQPIIFDKIVMRKEHAELIAKNKKSIIYSINYRDYAVNFKDSE